MSPFLAVSLSIVTSPFAGSFTTTAYSFIFSFTSTVFVFVSIPDFETVICFPLYSEVKTVPSTGSTSIPYSKKSL